MYARAHTHSWVILILFRFCACEFTHSLKLIGNPSRHPGPDRPGVLTVLAGQAASVPSPAQAPVGVSEGGGVVCAAGRLPSCEGPSFPKCVWCRPTVSLLFCHW